MSKLILTDVDEVLLEWGPAFERWVLGTGRFEIQGDVHLRDAYNIEHWLGIPHSTTRDLIAEFNSIPEEFANLKPYEDATRWVPELKRRGYDFVAVTACEDSTWSHDTRRDNLERYFPGVFDTIHCVGLGKSKVRHLERYQPTWWVDDKPGHCEDGFRLGHKSFMITRSYNVNDNRTGVKRVSGWDDIFNCITEEGCSYPGWYA